MATLREKGIFCYNLTWGYFHSSLPWVIYTGLPTKDETSETEIFLILGFPAPVNLFYFFLNIQEGRTNTISHGRILKLISESLYLRSFRPSLQTHSLWIILYLQCSLFIKSQL